MRIPNASPSGIVTNFETKCTDYFHPRVLTYILKNKVALIARQHNKATYHNGSNKQLHDELMRLSCSIVSCVSHFQPQATATILLSLSKLGFLQKQVYQGLTENFKFDVANSKSLSLVLYSFSKNNRALDYISRDFWINIADSVKKTLGQATTCDLSMYSLSIPALLLHHKLNRNEAQTVECLRELYSNIMNHVQGLLSENFHHFKSFELSSILQSTFIMKYNNINLQTLIVGELKNLIPKSLNGLSELIQVLDVLPPPALSASTIEQRNIKRKIYRTNKSLVEWSLDYLRNQLCYLKPTELARIAAVCNRLRIWSKDDFVLEFARCWHNLLNKSARTTSFDGAFQENGDSAVRGYNAHFPPSILSHGISYFLRRYESSVNRELIQEIKNDRNGIISKVSEACGNIGELLYNYAQEYYSQVDLHRIDSLIKIADDSRSKRSIKSLQHVMKITDNLKQS